MRTRCTCSKEADESADDERDGAGAEAVAVAATSPLSLLSSSGTTTMLLDELLSAADDGTVSGLAVSPAMALSSTATSGAWAGPLVMAAARSDEGDRRPSGGAMDRMRTR